MKYTITCDYFATGEGRTIMILYCIAQGHKDALEQFGRQFGGFYAHGAEVSEGFLFDSIEAKILVTDKVRELLDEGAGMLRFHSSIYVNYS